MKDDESNPYNNNPFEDRMDRRTLEDELDDTVPPMVERKSSKFSTFSTDEETATEMKPRKSFLMGKDRELLPEWQTEHSSIQQDPMMRRRVKDGSIRQVLPPLARVANAAPAMEAQKSLHRSESSLRTVDEHTPFHKPVRRPREESFDVEHIDTIPTTLDIETTKMLESEDDFRNSPPHRKQKNQRNDPTQRLAYSHTHHGAEKEIKGNNHSMISVAGMISGTKSTRTPTSQLSRYFAFVILFGVRFMFERLTS